MTVISRIPTVARFALTACTLVVVLAACSDDDAELADAVGEPTQQTTTTASSVDEASEPATPSTAPTEDAADDPEPATPDAPADEADEESEPVATDITGVITDIVADATGGRSTFDGTVDEIADLEALVIDAWGDGGLGLHRGHAQIENVLEAFLGIDHDQMHDYMDDGFNLADLAVELGRDADDLIETLTASYEPYVDEGVANGVITEDEAGDWVDLLRTEFTDRVNWDGVSAS